MASLRLEIVDGPEAGRVVDLDREVEIGRDPCVDVPLVDKLVSRHHARIGPDGDGAVIEDLGSSNGTLVNGELITGPTRIADGDTLLLGSSVVVLRRVVSAATGDEELVGSELAGYRIEAVVARGGMGVVYRAEDPGLGRKVALKVLPHALARNKGFRERFGRESRLAAAIDHPNIIPLYDAGTADGLLFLTMRFVDGLDLKALIGQEGPLALDRAISIVAQIGSALDAAHARGLVHRDVKPGNVLVASGAGPEDSDHCYLTDFGLTRDTSSPERLTASDEFVGTIDYTAPEQIQGDSHDGAADRYSLGCVLYECLTAHPPFERHDDLEVMRAHIYDEPPVVGDRRANMPRAIDNVVATAMAKDPAERYPTCAAMVTAARAASEGRRRRRGR